MRSAACLFVIRLRQSGQYLTLFDFDTKNVPHTVQRFFILGLKKLGIQELIKRKYGNPKPFAKQRIRDKLRAYALVPVVKQNTVSVIAVAALPAHKGIDFPALGRRKPLNAAHTSSAA